MRKNEFAVDGDEFGETYHLAAAMVICKEIKVCVVEKGPKSVFKQQKHFLSIVGGEDRVCSIPCEEYEERKFQRHGAATKIIAAGFKSYSQEIKRAFLKDVKPEDKEEVRCYLKRKGLLNNCPKILIWIRQKKCHFQKGI